MFELTHIVWLTVGRVSSPSWKTLNGNSKNAKRLRINGNRSNAKRKRLTLNAKQKLPTCVSDV